MPDTPPVEADPPPDDPALTPTWNPVEVMRGRAAAARVERDESIAERRATRDAEQILDECGIDLGEIER